MLCAPAKRRRRRVILATAAAAALLAFAPAAASARAGVGFFGLNIQPLIKYTFVPFGDWGPFIQTASSDDLRTVRMDAIWYWVQPAPPTAAGAAYDWNSSYQPDSMDHLVGLLAREHERLVAVIDSPPPWAAGPGTQLEPADYGAFERFAAAFAARYGAHGSFWQENPGLPYLPVEDFEIWDEANSSEFWSGTPSPSAYARVLAAASRRIHAVDRHAQVLASIGWQSFREYLRELYATGIGRQIDGIGFHPYAPDAPGILELNEELRATLRSLGAGRLPIYDTETGQPVVSAGPGAAYAYDGEVTDAARAATESLAGTALARSDCGVEDYLLYGITGSGTNLEPNHEGSMGLFNATSGAPDATGAALIAAAERWQRRRAGGIVLCGRGATRPDDLLGLGLSVTHSSSACVTGVVRYGANPLEGASLVLTGSGVRSVVTLTNADGRAQGCMQGLTGVKAFVVRAEIRNVAISQTFSCLVSDAPCAVRAR